MKSLFCLCIALLLVLPASAETPTSLEESLSTFMEEHSLNDENFALSWFNSATGESCSFNEHAFLPVGEVWYLPLHMYYYEQEARGAFEPEDETAEAFKIAGLTLEECRYQNLVLGEARPAEQMRDALGNYRQFKLLLNDAYGHSPTDSLTDAYLTKNTFSAAMLMNCLIYLDARTELFRGLTSNLRLAQSSDGLAGYGRQYSLVHLRGEEDGFLCDVAAVTAQQPYLLVCFVQEDAGGDEVLAEINAMFCDYVEKAKSQPAAVPDKPVQSPDTPTAPIVNTTTPNNGAFIWVLAAVGGMLLLSATVFLLFRGLYRRKHRF